MNAIAPLADSGDSICYQCLYWDWAVLFDPPAWQHICRSPNECTPGDHVTECEGFKNDNAIHP